MPSTDLALGSGGIIGSFFVALNMFDCFWSVREGEVFFELVAAFGCFGELGFKTD